MNSKEISKIIDRIPNSFDDEFVQVARDYLDLLAKQEDTVLVVEKLLEELSDLAMDNDLPIDDKSGYFGTGLPLRILHKWIIEKQNDQSK